MTMISRYKYHALTWVDMESPTNEEVRQIMEEFDIHPIAADELLGPSLRPKVDQYENFIYLILHFPAIRHSHKSKSQEVDFIIGKQFLITVRYELLDPLHKFSKVFEVNSILDRSDIGDHAGFLFFYMIRKIYSSLGHELSMIGDSLKSVEDRIFNGEEREMVAELSMIHRDLLEFHRALRMHRGVLQSLARSSEDFFGNDFVHYSENIMGEFLKVEEVLQDEREVLSELRTTNDSLLTTKTNEIMKVLTATTFLILPAALIGQLFGMNTKHTPIVGMDNDFWVILAFMSIFGLATLAYFKYKKWI
ncbi:MAG: Mg2 transporter protein CorA family protein [Parcubacteria group bacterium GW2011_GWA2_47_7]|nr:MAG: Mg2 transporter protein CorA family protein [Parcubacteria group bacterium GW2011_GWA2_47_7]